VARTAAATRPQTPKEAPPRKWILVGVAAVALVIAAAAIPRLTGDPPNRLEQERPGIEAAMGRFRTAYRNRNLEGVAAVFPALPAETGQAMQRAFDDCLVYEVTFADMQVEVNLSDASLAQVDVSSTHVCTPNSGGRQTTTTQHDLFTLRKNGNEWRIDGVAPAPATSADGAQ
jgi:ketosteroid isomerase-like protein